MSVNVDEPEPKTIFGASVTEAKEVVDEDEDEKVEVEEVVRVEVSVVEGRVAVRVVRMSVSVVVPPVMVEGAGVLFC